MSSESKNQQPKFSINTEEVKKLQATANEEYIKCIQQVVAILNRFIEENEELENINVLLTEHDDKRTLLVKYLANTTDNLIIKVGNKVFKETKSLKSFTVDDVDDMSKNIISMIDNRTHRVAFITIFGKVMDDIRSITNKNYVNKFISEIFSENMKANKQVARYNLAAETKNGVESMSKKLNANTLAVMSKLKLITLS